MHVCYETDCSYIWIYIYLCVCGYVRTCVCQLIHTHTHTHTYIYIYIYIYKFHNVCLWTQYIYIYIYIYIYKIWVFFPEVFLYKSSACMFLCLYIVVLGDVEVVRFLDPDQRLASYPFSSKIICLNMKGIISDWTGSSGKPLLLLRSNTHSQNPSLSLSLCLCLCLSLPSLQSQIPSRSSCHFF